MRQSAVRVAFIWPAFPALSETFILNQATGLRDLGVQIDIYASTPREGVQHPDVAAYRLLQSTYYMPTSYLAQHPGTQTPILRDLSLLRHNLHKRSVRTAAWSQSRAPGGIAAVWRMMAGGLTRARLQHYDVVHAHYGFLGAEALRLQSYGLLRGPLVTSFHGFDMSSYLRQTGPQAYRDLFQQGAAFLPATAYWASQLRSWGCPADRLCVHRMGVDLRRFEFRASRLPLGKEIRLLSVGRLVEKKGFTYGIEAVRQLLPEFPTLRYDIIGEGLLRGDLERQIARSGLRNIVRLMGARDQPYVLDAMRASDVLLVPSVTAANGDMEGLPVVLLEAMAMGLPVVSTRHSGIPELVEDDVTGMLVDERDSVGLAARLRSLLTAPETCNRLTRGAREKIEADFNIEKQVSKLVDLYKALALERATASETSYSPDGRKSWFT